MVGYRHEESGVVGRLRRVEGQIRGVEKMVEEDRYCIDALTQVSAGRAALESVALLLLREHTEHSVTDAISSGDPGPKVRELSEAIKQMVRS